MDIRPDLLRLQALDLSGFKQGDTVLFCPACPWQAPCPQGMAPICPQCGAGLHLTRVDTDLINLTQAPGAHPH